MIPIRQIDKSAKLGIIITEEYKCYAEDHIKTVNGVLYWSRLL